MISRCILCGNLFESKTLKRKYCSEECLKEIRKQKRAKYLIKNRNKILKQRTEYRNRYEIKKRRQLYRLSNFKNISEQNKKYKKENKIKIKESKNNYVKRKRKNDEFFNYVTNQRSRLCHFFKNINIKKRICSKKIIGCSRLYFVNYIEARFTCEMTWENRLTTWEFDHIIPLSYAKTEEEIYILNNYLNIEPKLINDNRRKSNKMFRSDIIKIKKIKQLYNIYKKYNIETY